MTNRTVVFLGPTLGQEEASRILDAIYQPPAAQGDVVRAVVSLRADCIVLIDGVFATAPAVRHKEILWALGRGVRVYGAASMGALRAAELHSYGMKGHGLIYRWYRATPLADDDEVAVAMMPSELGSHALSEALVDIRLTLRGAERCGIISPTMRRLLEATARELHFIDRTYMVLFDEVRRLVPNDGSADIHLLEAWVARHAVRQKRKDAIDLLHHVASRRFTRGPIETTPFRMTEAWAADLDAAGLLSENIL